MADDREVVQGSLSKKKKSGLMSFLLPSFRRTSIFGLFLFSSNSRVGSEYSVYLILKIYTGAPRFSGRHFTML